MILANTNYKYYRMVISMESNSNIFKTYTLDYLGKYYFYEEDEFLKAKENGQYILEKLKVGCMNHAVLAFIQSDFLAQAAAI